MNFERGRKGVDISRVLRGNVHKIPGSYSGNQQKFFNPSPESNASSPPVTTSKERESTVDSGVSLRMMSKSDLTPEEQETI